MVPAGRLGVAPPRALPGLAKTPNLIIYGNTDMWVAAFIAGGVRWAWPSVLITIKPSLAFFAVIGIRSPRWWIAAAILAVASLPFISLWLLYPSVMGNSTAGWAYSLSNLPFHLLPIVAWLASTRRGSVSIGRWALLLLDTSRADRDTTKPAAG